jgi:hypothetical protein
MVVSENVSEIQNKIITIVLTDIFRYRQNSMKWLFEINQNTKCTIIETEKETEKNKIQTEGKWVYHMKKVKNITVTTKLLDVNKKKWKVVIF